ncbi:MAG: universal stress protein, partial [Gemmatimonadota bacterium]
LVRRLAVPMLLVRPSEEAPGSRTTPAVARILVPLDGSPLAESILQPAGELALHLGAAVVLLRVLETGAYLGTPYLPEVAEQHEEHIEAVERQSKEYLDDVARRLEARGVDVADTLLRSGAPAAVIEEVARHTAELIAMATHGRGGVQRLLLGSVSDKVLRGGTQPLLLLRPDEERPDEERPGEEPGAREPAP